MEYNVTGYQIRERLREVDLHLRTLEGLFNDSLSAFPGETKRLPTSLSEEIEEHEALLADLQDLQQRYNAQVEIQVEDKTLTLSQAIKRVGGAGRHEKRWRQLVAPKKSRYDGYSSRETERDPSKVYAISQVTNTEAAERAKRFARYAGRLKSAIAAGNAERRTLTHDRPNLL